METSFRLGLIPDRHLDQLTAVMKYSRDAFSDRPAVSDFFASLKLVLKREKKRRLYDLEGEWFEINVEHGFSRICPSARVCLYDFFLEKAEEFEESEPPIASFFKRVAKQLKKNIEEEVSPTVLEEINKARQSLTSKQV